MTIKIADIGGFKTLGRCPIGINLTESCLYSKFGSNLLNAVLFFYPLICIVFMKFQANVKAKSP